MEGKTREPQYQRCIEIVRESGRQSFGAMANQTWLEDPKRLTFVLSRYKFAAKMLAGSRHVLEVGCGDAFGTRIVRQAVDRVTAIDFDAVLIREARETASEKWPIDLVVHDILEGPIAGEFDGAYSLDVIEHIPAAREDAFVANISRSLGPRGVLVVGTPSLESQPYASLPSRAGHVNCKSQPALRELLARFFENVFLFSMNDEVVHTGYFAMAHYNMALCSSPRSDSRGGSSVQNPLPPSGLGPPSHGQHAVRDANRVPAAPLADRRGAT